MFGCNCAVARSTDVSTKQLKFGRWPFLEKASGGTLFLSGSTTAVVPSRPSYPFSLTTILIFCRPALCDSSPSVMGDSFFRRGLALAPPPRPLSLSLSLSLAHLFGLSLVGCIASKLCREISILDSPAFSQDIETALPSTPLATLACFPSAYTLGVVLYVSSASAPRRYCSRWRRARRPGRPREEGRSDGSFNFLDVEPMPAMRMKSLPLSVVRLSDSPLCLAHLIVSCPPPPTTRKPPTANPRERS